MFTKQKPDDPQPEQSAPIDDDVEPPKVGPDGFMSREWSRWEMLRAEKRLTGTRRPSEQTLSDLAQLDALIEQTQAMVQTTARMKVTLQARIDEAAGNADRRFLPGGLVAWGTKPHLGKLAELRRQHGQAAAAMQEAKDEEVRLRVLRGEFSAGAQVAGSRVRVPDDGNRAYSYSADRVIDGKVISG